MMAEERLRIARSVAAIRGDWTIEDVEAFLRLHLKNHPYRDVSVALVAVAHIERSRPELVLSKGPWWKAVEQLGGTSPVTAQRHPQCEIHRRCPNHDDHPVGADRCPDCQSTLVTDAGTVHALAEAARAEISHTFRERRRRQLEQPVGHDSVIDLDAARALIDQAGGRS